jgi:hypothetical protein
VEQSLDAVAADMRVRGASKKILECGCVWQPLREEKPKKLNQVKV